MPILLSHNSSLEYLRSVPPQVDKAVPVDEPLPMELFVKTKDRPRELELKKLGLSQRPVHTLIPTQKHALPGLVYKPRRTAQSELPPGTVRQVSPSVYVCGPELTFIQMAQTLSTVGLIVLGFELCGTYSHFSKMVSGFYERPSLTSVAKIAEVIGAVPGMKGANAARKALRWIRDGSASPMETVVSCMLGLPTEAGGFGLVAPTLNHKVKLNAAEQRILGKRRCYIDTAYEAAMTGVEFDGMDYHRDAEADRLRREVLVHKGWKILVLNVDELTSWDRLAE